MTLVTIDVSDVASETHPDDRVIFWAPRHRPGTTTAKHALRLAGGLGEVELKPGPTMVQFQCLGIADTQPKLGTVPESGTVTLDDVLDGSWEYSPEVVKAAQQARDDAIDAREAAARQAVVSQEGAARVGSAERVLEAESVAVDAAAEAVAAAMVSGRRRVDMENPSMGEIDAALAVLPEGSTVMNLSTGEVWAQ